MWPINVHFSYVWSDYYVTEELVLTEPKPFIFYKFYANG